jgi:hypothetical protein
MFLDCVLGTERWSKCVVAVAVSVVVVVVVVAAVVSACYFYCDCFLYLWALFESIFFVKNT